jgi:hypothetical protein
MFIVGAPSCFPLFLLVVNLPNFITRKQESFELISGWLGSLIEDLKPLILQIRYFNFSHSFDPVLLSVQYVHEFLMIK